MVRLLFLFLGAKFGTFSEVYKGKIIIRRGFFPICK